KRRGDRRKKAGVLTAPSAASHALSHSGSEGKAIHASVAHSLSGSKAEAYIVHPRVQQSLTRDAKRQAGTRKERRPKVDDGMDREILAKPAATRQELWDGAPDWITEQIGRDRFFTRVSKVRKNRTSRK